MDELVGGAAVRPERLLGLRRPARQQRPRLATQLQRQTNLKPGNRYKDKRILYGTHIRACCTKNQFATATDLNNAITDQSTNFTRTSSELPYNTSTMGYRDNTIKQEI